MSENTNSVSRRSLLKGAAVGGLGLVAGSTLAAGSADAATRLKGSTVRWTTRGGGATGDKIAKAVNDAFTKKTGAKVVAQQVNSDDFQNNFAQIMQGSPDDAFGWMVCIMCSLQFAGDCRRSTSGCDSAHMPCAWRRSASSSPSRATRGAPPTTTTR